MTSWLTSPSSSPPEFVSNHLSDPISKPIRVYLVILLAPTAIHRPAYKYRTPSQLFPQKSTHKALPNRRRRGASGTTAKTRFRPSPAPLSSSIWCTASRRPFVACFPDVSSSSAAGISHRSVAVPRSGIEHRRRSTPSRTKSLTPLRSPSRGESREAIAASGEPQSEQSVIDRAPPPPLTPELTGGKP